MDAVLIPLFSALGLAMALYAWAVPQGGPRWWPCAIATLALVILGRLLGDGPAGAVLSGLAEIAAAALVWSHGTPDAIRAARRLLPAAVAGMLLAGAGAAMAAGTSPESGWGRIAVALLMLGYALRLGLLPVYFWLPAVARAVPAMTTALLLAVVDVNVFCELLSLRHTTPWVFQSFAAPWTALAMLSAIGGALLALAQLDLKTMLAFSSIDDLGFLLLGVIAGGDGLAGAWLGLVSHATSKLVLFGAVGAAEYSLGTDLTLDARGLATRLPLAGASFMLGALGFLGMPPTLGFVGHWRLYLAGVELGGPVLLAALLAGSGMALLCYARAIHRVWLGPADARPGRPLPTLGGTVLILVALSTLAFGIAPAAVQPAGPLQLAAIGQRVAP